MSSLIKLNRKISSPLKSRKKFSKDKKFSIRQTNFIFQFVSYFIEIYYKKCLDDSSIQGVDLLIRFFIEEIKNPERNIEKMYYYVSNICHLKHMLIENFNKKTIKLLLEVMNYKFISYGNLIYKKGENPCYFYGIIKGEVGIINDFDLIKKEELNNINNIGLLCKNIFKSGDFLGEKEIFLNSSRYESAFSITDIHLFYIDRKSFIKLLYKNIFSLYECKLKFIKNILKINDEQKDNITNKYFDINVFLTIIESTLYMKDEKIIDQNEISQKIFFVYKNSCIVKRKYIDFRNNNSDCEKKIIYDNSKKLKNIKLLNLMPSSLFGGEFIIDPNNLNSFSVYASNNFTIILSFDKTCFDKILNISINQKASIILHLQSIVIKMMEDINKRYNFFLCLMSKKNSLLINKNEVMKKENSQPLIINNNKKEFYLRNIKQENNLINISKEKTLNKNKKLKIEIQKKSQPSLLRKDYIINGRNIKYLIDEFSLNTQIAKEEHKRDKISIKSKFYITSISNTKLKKYDNDQSHSNSFITYDYPMNVKINSFQKIINLKKLIKPKNLYYNSGKLNIPLITNFN